MIPTLTVDSLVRQSRKCRKKSPTRQNFKTKIFKHCKKWCFMNNLRTQITILFHQNGEALTLPVGLTLNSRYLVVRTSIMSFDNNILLKFQKNLNMLKLLHLLEEPQEVFPQKHSMCFFCFLRFQKLKN